MKIDPETGKQYCTTREELVNKHFVTDSTEETYGYSHDKNEYVNGNRAIIELIERFRHDIQFDLTPEEMEYWEDVFRDIDGVLERDEKKRRRNMEPREIREFRKYVEGDPWRIHAVLEVLGWTAVRKMRGETDVRNYKVWLIIAGLMEDAHKTIKNHICKAIMERDEEAEKENAEIEGAYYEDIESAIDAIEEDLRKRHPNAFDD